MSAWACGVSRMTDLDLAAIRARAEAATSGPWHWAGNTDTGEPYLATWIKGAGRCQVLSIGTEPRDMHDQASETYRSYLRETGEYTDEEIERNVEQLVYDQWDNPNTYPRLQFLNDLMCVNARDLAIYEVAPEATSREDPDVYRADITGIRHPDAEHIAGMDPATTLALLAEIERLQAAVNGFEYKYPCDGLCSYERGPEEDCSRHGRSPADLRGIITDLIAERDARDATIDRVRELHREGSWDCRNPMHTNADIGCPECVTVCDGCSEVQPCPTLRALTNALEGEW